MGAMSFWHWLLVLAVVILVFGTRRLSTLGSDLGAAIKGFRHSMREGEEEPTGQRPVEPKLPDANSSANRVESTTVHPQAKS
jgi:sec-independent protein translocase protein TatA